MGLHLPNDNIMMMESKRSGGQGTDIARRQEDCPEDVKGGNHKRKYGHFIIKKLTFNYDVYHHAYYLIN